MTVVMDKTDYHDKMDELVNDKQTYEVLKRDPTPALQRKLNSKLLQLKKADAINIRRYNRLRCPVPQPAKLYGLPKLHKPNVPMRPIVSFSGSPTYELSKYLTTILKPLTDESRHKLQSTETFIDAIKTAQVPDDHELVSFDVKSLFTSIPLQLALDCTETAISNSTLQLPLLTNDLMDLLNLCLTSTYFQYNGQHYKQLHGTAMGSPVSVVVAEIVMQNIEEQALASYTRTIPLWYIKGTSEIIARILQPYNIRVAHRPITTLRKLLTNVKDKDQPRDRQGAVYKIKCCDCQATYIGETGRNLNTRLTEHRRATRNGDINNNIAEHHLQTNHRIDWDSATCVTYNTNYFQRIVLESWFTNLEQTLINRCLQLPAPYKRLIDDINRQTTH